MTTLKEDLKTVSNGLIALERVINQLSTKVEELESKNGNGNVSVPNTLLKNLPISNPTKVEKDGYTLFKKDVEFITNLLDTTTNEKSKNFLLNVLNNDYTTITEGQKTVLDKIAEQSIPSV